LDGGRGSSLTSPPPPSLPPLRRSPLPIQIVKGPMFAVQVSHVHVTSYQHIYTTGPTFQHRVAPILGNWGRKEGERDVGGGGGEGRWGQEGRAGQGREEEAGAVAGCARSCWYGAENSMRHPKEGAGVGWRGSWELVECVCRDMFSCEGRLHWLYTVEYAWLFRERVVHCTGGLIERVGGSTLHCRPSGVVKEDLYSDYIVCVSPVVVSAIFVFPSHKNNAYMLSKAYCYFVWKRKLLAVRRVGLMTHHEYRVDRPFPVT
jgi:hypothetical protein